MNTSRTIYPSTRRYMDENPAITFRMKKHEKERLVTMAREAGVSVSTLVRVGLLGLEKKFSEANNKARNEGYDKGFKEAKNAYRIWNFCNVCNNAIDIVPNSDAHKAIIDYLKKEKWGHPECHEKAADTQPS